MSKEAFILNHPFKIKLQIERLRLLLVRVQGDNNVASNRVGRQCCKQILEYRSYATLK